MSKGTSITKGRVERGTRLNDNNFSLWWGDKCSTIEYKKEKNESQNNTD